MTLAFVLIRRDADVVPRIYFFCGFTKKCLFNRESDLDSIELYS